MSTYYQNNKERPQNKAGERYQSYSKKENEEKEQFSCEWCRKKVLLRKEFQNCKFASKSWFKQIGGRL